MTIKQTLAWVIIKSCDYLVMDALYYSAGVLDGHNLTADHCISME